ncbi:MAG: ATP-binding cassette domain-containing protein [Lachnospiraceae bacterium]|nr:ATP-binding cassette domain-containing protein [Lachnospiraceae bacterium]
MELILEKISKSYDGGKSYALRDFSMKFHPGVYGLLGANGAGKSTLINLITQNLHTKQGKITWDGQEIASLGKEYRKLLGYMPQQQNLYDNFTGEEFMWYMAALKGLKKNDAKKSIEDLLKTVRLEDKKYQRIRGYSGGMKQRLLIAQALLNDPSILIMDEPTAGLDPKERIRIRNFISKIATGKIVIIATHVVSDIEFIAKEILLLQKGKVIQKKSPKELLDDMKGKVWNAYVTPEQLKEIEQLGKRIVSVSYGGDKICARFLSEEEKESDIIKPAIPNLEDVYLYYEAQV